MNATSYTSQADALKDIVAFFWGDVPARERKVILPERGFSAFGCHHAVYATADVNGRLVSFELDNWGRKVSATVLPR